MPLNTAIPSLTTTAIDGGARYGRVPSRDQFGGELHYLAFKPDAEDAKKVRSQYPSPEYEVLETALGKTSGYRTYHLTKHGGFFSFYTADPDNLSSRTSALYRVQGTLQSAPRLLTAIVT